ncbi:MAG: glycosyltransferase family 1 protein [Pseudomonadota bacterium]
MPDGYGFNRSAARRVVSVGGAPKVALFSGNYNYVTDGANKALNRWVGYLESRGAEVRVFSPTSPTPAFEPQGTLISVPSFSFPGRSDYRVGLPLGRKQKRMLEAFRPDIIHLSAPDMLGTSALKYGLKNDIPIVCSFHTRFDTYFRYYNLGFVEKGVRRHMRWFYSQCRHVYIPSQSMADVLIEEGIVSRSNQRVWSRGVELDQFSPNRRDMAWRRSMGVDDDEIVVSFVGRLVREKGLNRFARVMKALWDGGVQARAMIVGDGPERATMEATLPEAVFTGHLSGVDLARAYASSDIYFNPSLTETFGNVTVEAMASGVATVAMDATGSASIINDGRNGVLLDPDGDDPYFECFASLCRDKAKRDRMARTGLADSASYSWDRINAALYDQYLEVLNEISQTARAA